MRVLRVGRGWAGSRWWLVVPLLAAAAVVVAPPAQAATFTVTTNADAGAGSLRQAILDANASVGVADDIVFDAAVTTITLATALPTITDALTIDGGGDVTVSGNNSVRVLEVNAPGNLTLVNLTVANGSTTGGHGAGVFNGGTLTVTNSTFSGNAALVGWNGGAIASAGTLAVSSSTFVLNSATTFSALGGGIYVRAGTASIVNSTFSGNSAIWGGGLFSAVPTTVVNSTFSANAGGGVYASANTTTLRNTIVANSTSGGDCDGAVADGGNNIVEDGSCGFAGGADPLLGALASNGGPTQSFALLAGSPALDAGSNATCAASDQRGLARPQGASCDIGAYEALRLTVADLSQSEGSTFNFAVSLSAALPAGFPSVTVDYSTAAGGANPATAGSDYAAVGATALTFTAGGAATQNAAVTVSGDMTVEPDETFLLNLASAANAVLADAQALGTILDDDSAPVPAAAAPTPAPDTQAAAAAPTPAPDTQAPSAPALSLDLGRGIRLDFGWERASDNVGVTGYELLRAGVVVASVAGLELRIPPRLLDRNAPTVFTLVALDAAGNRSAASNPITVVARARPQAAPSRIPRWAWELLVWRATPVADRALRPVAAPRLVPAWYWQWAAWRIRPYLIRA